MANLLGLLLQEIVKIDSNNLGSGGLLSFDTVWATCISMIVLVSCRGHRPMFAHKSDEAHNPLTKHVCRALGHFHDCGWPRQKLRTA